MGKTFLSFVLLAFFVLVGAQSARAVYLFKIGSLAPAGSVWDRYFHDFAKEVAKKTNGEVKFRVYAGGVMGDDRAMYRKMRIGQLQGGGFTMTGLSEIVPDFRVMGIPFLFTHYDQVDRVMKGLMPRFKAECEGKGLVLLATTEVGFIYTMSAEPVDSIASLRKSKAWAPENDPVSLAYLKNIGVTPVPLSIPDVLPSLQTGLVDTVFNSYYGAIVLQWFTSTKYITDIPFGYAYGGLVLSKKAFDRLPGPLAEACISAADHHFSRLVAESRKSNAEALATLKKQGLTVVTPRPGEADELNRQRDRLVKEINGTYFSREIYQEAMAALAGDEKQAGKR